MALRFKEPKSEKRAAPRRDWRRCGGKVTAAPARADQGPSGTGPAYKNTDLVCARLHSTPLDPSELTAGFAKLIKSLDLPRVRLHDLRHGHATHLLRLGIHPKVVSERLGHFGGRNHPESA